MPIKKIGVLTGGGDCPGLNAVIRAIVKPAIYCYGIEIVGILDGYKGLVEGLVTPLTEASVSGIIARGGTILGTSNRSDPFEYEVPDKKGDSVTRDRSQDVLRQIKSLELDGLIVIGGDGTLSIAQRLFEMEVPVVGIPKTIDNDLEATDITFGFNSALNIATDAVDRLHTTAESHHRVMILEVMGRYAGWIALRAGLAGGGDVILIPEIRYDFQKVCDAIRKRADLGKRFSIVVVAEGARSVEGQMVVQKIVKGSPDPLRLGGIGQVIAQQLENKTELESRVVILGHLQRGGIPTPFDRWLATRFGVAALELLISRYFGRMVCLRGEKIESVELKEAVSRPHRVDPQGEEVHVAKSVGTSFGD